MRPPILSVKVKFSLAGAATALTCDVSAVSEALVVRGVTSQHKGPGLCSRLCPVGGLRAFPVSV